jgi:hypothetical protein
METLVCNEKDDGNFEGIANELEKYFLHCTKKFSL